MHHQKLDSLQPQSMILQLFVHSIMCNISMPKHRRTCQMFSVFLKLSIMIRIFMPAPCVLPVLLHHVPIAIRSCNQNYMETEEGAHKDGAIVHIAIPGFGMWYNCRLYHERKTLKPCVFLSNLQNCKRIAKGMY